VGEELSAGQSNTVSLMGKGHQLSGKYALRLAKNRSSNRYPKKSAGFEIGYNNKEKVMASWTRLRNLLTTNWKIRNRCLMKLETLSKELHVLNGTGYFLD